MSERKSERECVEISGNESAIGRAAMAIALPLVFSKVAVASGG